MSRRWPVAALALLVVLGAAWLARRPLRSAGGWLLGWPERAARARLALDPVPFARLAASQVGYGPAFQKRFTSPRPFESFEIVDAGDGRTVLRGGAPLAVIPTTELGAGDRVWIGDFSALHAPGRYRIRAAGLESHPFDVGRGVFDPALRAVQRAFYYQRAFTAVEPRHAGGPWVHGSDAALAPPGVRGGWHDAGDFSLYSASTNTALFWMLETWSDFAPADDDLDLPESGNGVPDLLDEARWGLLWLLSVQGASGGFASTTCQERYGPYGTNLPEHVPPYRAGEVGTLATARAVGTLAYASTTFRRIDPVFAEQLLSAALRGERYLAVHPEDSDGPTCPAYRADGDRRIGQQTRMYAAAGLLLATGEARHREAFEGAAVPVDEDPSYLNVGGFAARIYLRASTGAPERKEALLEAMRARAKRARLEGERDPFQRSAPRFWGSIGAGFTRTGASSIPLCLQAPGAASPDCAQALANVHHALGRNLLALVYVSGLPGVSRGREHAFHHWLATLQARPFLFPGLVAGGPNEHPEASDVSRPLARPRPVWGYQGDPAFPRDERTPYERRYTDNDSWSTNEVSLDWQASALYSLAFARWAARSFSDGAAAPLPGSAPGQSR